MAHLRLSAVAAAAALWVTFAAPARAETGVTNQYLEHYLSGDIAGLAPYMGDSMHFHDSAAWFDGKDAVLEGLTRTFADIPEISFEESTRIHSGHDTLIEGTLTFDYAGRTVGVPGHVFHFETPFAVSVREVDQKVVSHIDFIDVPTFSAQLEAQLKTEK
nr:nuclear transport factor 2 family protein [uncultured Hyphomonas sp.]